MPPASRAVDRRARGAEFSYTRFNAVARVAVVAVGIVAAAAALHRTECHQQRKVTAVKRQVMSLHSEHVGARH